MVVNTNIYLKYGVRDNSAGTVTELNILLAEYGTVLLFPETSRHDLGLKRPPF